MNALELLPENYKPMQLRAADHKGFATLFLEVFHGQEGDLDGESKTVVDVTVSYDLRGKLTVYAGWPESFGQVEGRGEYFANAITGRSGLCLNETHMTPDEARVFVAALVRKVRARFR